MLSQSSQLAHSSQTYEMISVLFLTLAKGEQILQCLKYVLTLNPFFHPLALFKYISKGEPTFTRRNILTLLYENQQTATDEYIRLLFGKDHVSYGDFIEYIYPYNTAVIRYIGNVHLKRYAKLEKCPLDHDALTTFLLLIDESVSLINRLYVQKQDSMLQIPKEKLRRIVKSMKKAGNKMTEYCSDNNEEVVTALEFRNFMKAFVQVYDHHFLYLSSRLKMHEGAIPVETLENFIKPWKKPTKKVLGISPAKKRKYNEEQGQTPLLKKDNSEYQTRIINLANVYERNNGNSEIVESNLKQINQNSTNRRIIEKYFKEKYYREYLFKELKDTLKLYKVVNDKQKNVAMIIQKQVANAYNHNRNYFQDEANCYNRSSSYQPQSQIYPRRGSQSYYQPKIATLKANNIVLPSAATSHATSQKVFLDYVQLCLRSTKYLYLLKYKLAVFQIDNLKLFKAIDRHEQGVITPQDLYQFYLEIGGHGLSMSEIALIVKRYSVCDYKWLSFSEFSEILRLEHCDPSRVSFAHAPQSAYWFYQSHSLILQILSLTALFYLYLQYIKHQFPRNSSKKLFQQINEYSNGFINYQYMKKYLTNCGMKLSMHEIMSLLKRLDKSKNGVVLYGEFIDFFEQ